MIQIRLINKSNDSNNSNILFFQKNEVLGLEDIPVAWKVISCLGQGDFHPFSLPDAFEVFMIDSYGNYSLPLPARKGTKFQVKLEASGNRLTYWDHDANKLQVSVYNRLQEGAVSICAQKDGRIISMKTGVSPGQKAVFQFQPVIFVATCSQQNEGEGINSAILPKQTTELNLSGVASTDIILSGGGTGPKATSFKFKLENIVML